MHPLDISVSGFSGLVGQKPGVADQGRMHCEDVKFRNTQSIRRGKKQVRGRHIFRTAVTWVSLLEMLEGESWRQEEWNEHTSFM